MRKAINSIIRFLDLSIRFFATRKEYLIFVVFIPAVFFLTFFLVNYDFLQCQNEELGDHAAYALQIERAKHLEEFLGPYSRFDFNHPGPITFYCYAFLSFFVVFFEHEFGRYMFIQLLLNILFLFLSLHMISSSFKKKTRPLVFFGAFLLALCPFGAEIFFETWPPFLLIFPMLTFILAVAKISFGELHFILHATLSATFIIQNHVAGLPLVFPLFLLSLLIYLWNKRKFSLRISKTDRIFLGLSAAFFLITFFPPLHEQFSSEKGNLTKIYEVLSKQETFEHSFLEASNCILGYFFEPLRIIFHLDSRLFVFLLLGLSLTAIRRERHFVNYLIFFSFLAIALSLIAALLVPGPLIPHILLYVTAFVILIFFLCTISLSSFIKIHDFKKTYLYLFLIISMVFMIFNSYNLRSDHPIHKLEAMMDAIRPNNKYEYELFWRSGGRHHMQWSVATGLALKMIRKGIHVYVPEEHHVIFGKKLSNKGKRNLRRILLYSTGEQIPRVREKRFIFGDTILEFGKMLPLPFPLVLRFDYPDEYFQNFSFPEKNGRWSHGSSASVILPLGKLPPGIDKFAMEIFMQIPGDTKIEVLLNEKVIKTFYSQGQLAGPRILELDSSFLRSEEENLLKFNIAHFPHLPIHEASHPGFLFEEVRISPANHLPPHPEWNRR